MDLPKNKSQERFPLLTYFVENGNLDATKKVCFENSRYDRIHNGAAKIFKDWPSYFGTCWVSFICLALFFFMVLLVVISSGPVPKSRHARCSQDLFQANETIHLVHEASLNFKELVYLEKIFEVFKSYKINLILIQPEPVQVKLEEVKQNFTRSKRQDSFAKQLINMLMRSRRFLVPHLTLKEVLEKHPEVSVRNATYSQLFLETPFYLNYYFFSEHLKIFAARILQLWQFGGLSFDLCQQPALKNNFIPKMFELTTPSQPPSTTTLQITTSNITKTTASEMDLNLEKQRFLFEHLPEQLVKADDHGLVMETKTPCHAFFAEVMGTLKNIKEPEASVKDVLRKSLKIFCQYSVATRAYCDTL